jgi:hypothetical protein
MVAISEQKKWNNIIPVPSLDDSNVRSEEVPQNSRTPYSFQLKRGYPQIHCFVIISPSQISTSCWLLDIHFILVGGAITILKNDGVRQWEGWHPIYEMDNQISCLKPPTSITFPFEWSWFVYPHPFELPGSILTQRRDHVRNSSCESNGFVQWGSRILRPIKWGVRG